MIRGGVTSKNGKNWDNILNDVGEEGVRKKYKYTNFNFEILNTRMGWGKFSKMSVL